MWIWFTIVIGKDGLYIGVEINMNNNDLNYLYIELLWNSDSMDNNTNTTF